MKKFFTIVVLFAMMYGCATAPESTNKPIADSNAAQISDNNEYQFTESSKQNTYRVSLKSNVNPLPLDTIHSWTLLLQNSDGKTIDDAKIMVYGGMPAHKHGFPTNPQVTEKLGSGRYLVDGIKFSMPGQWEIWLDIVANGKKDKAIFTIDVS